MVHIINVSEYFSEANNNHEDFTSMVHQKDELHGPKIQNGLCKTCCYNGSCVWQQANKLHCEHLN